MRLKITIDAKNRIIPYEYHGFLQAVLYSAFDEDTGDFLHNKGFVHEDKVYKMFVFSELIGRYEPKKEGLLFTSNVSFYVSSAYPELLQELWDYFSNQMSISLGKNQFDIVALEPDNEPIEENEDHIYLLKTISPITAYRTDEKRYTNFFNPKSQDFEENLQHNLERKYMTLFGEEPTSEFFRIKEIKKQKRYIVKYKRFTYESYILSFKAEISPKFLFLALHTGLGAKNAAGFGMVEIVRKKS